MGTTQTVLAFLGTAVIAYFLGCFNGAVIVSKYILRDDVRTHGSGNAGLTNFHRTFGGPLTFVVILCDVLKAVIAVLIGAALIGGALQLDTAFAASLLKIGNIQAEDYGKYWGGIWCLLGHMFPCMFGFKGGKGILSGGAVAIMIDWRVALVVWGGFLILAVLTRYVSLGSCWAGASFPFATWFVYQNWIITLMALFIGGMILWKHRSNIGRLIRGEESKFTLHKKEPKA
ncbi:glycerol-3-phosphate acyltransferase [Pseudoflavonifractor phocaeensis]|uniref:glycerol-3-phosphate acyltransferase n=1 Tax=Pseudoflavonifractor phocaeensis TaxID=1870988 RepID=UPI00195A1721|nr:glycerol-3-phosphate acyltransferase [Pseudoflavonifractor phocaeensis]MBM6937230.1 glycerol-3-phosphate acyltransferase [Pseudoflavonifractor phocaeensis]